MGRGQLILSQSRTCHQDHLRTIHVPSTWPFTVPGPHVRMGMEVQWQGGSEMNGVRRCCKMGGDCFLQTFEEDFRCSTVKVVNM